MMTGREAIGDLTIWAEDGRVLMHDMRDNSTTSQTPREVWRRILVIQKATKQGVASTRDTNLVWALQRVCRYARDQRDPTVMEPVGTITCRVNDEVGRCVETPPAEDAPSMERSRRVIKRVDLWHTD